MPFEESIYLIARSLSLRSENHLRYNHKYYLEKSIVNDSFNRGAFMLHVNSPPIMGCPTAAM